MKIACVGGGPAGLYFALLMRLGSAGHDVTVIERDREGSSYGWGVTFGGDVLDELHRHDPVSAREIGHAAFRWTGQVVDIRGTRVRHASGYGYSIRRHRLLGIMASRARDLGVHIEFGREATSPAQLPEADLIVASDGANSRIRLNAGGFETSARLSRNKYIWLGTDKVFEAFMYAFAHTDSGWVWAVALAGSLRRAATVEVALRSYEAQRRAALGPPRGSARLSAQWFENLSRYTGLEPRQFSMLLHGRQSPIIPYISPRLFFELLGATDNVMILQKLRHRAGPQIKAIYGRRDPVADLPSSSLANVE